MNVTIEISLYPLNKEYESVILAFIERLKQRGLNPTTDSVSTKVSGLLLPTMQTLTEELELSFGRDVTQVAVLKIVHKA